MRPGRPRPTRGHRLGITLLILGLFHVPLPEPDYHNARHHDAPAEVCEHHDHLLRWHPDAVGATDVAILHWHWVFPSSGTPDRLGPGDGAALHAHAGGWDAPTIEPAPAVVASGLSLVFEPAPPRPLAPFEGLPSGAAPTPRTRAGPNRDHAFGATFAPHTSLACLLQRWAC